MLQLKSLVCMLCALGSWAGAVSGQTSSATMPNATDQWSAERNRKMHQMADRGNKPIELFGKVIDQFGKGVEGAAVEATIRRIGSHDGTWFPSDETVELRTSADGTFRMNGSKTGYMVIVSKVEKEGYEWLPTAGWGRIDSVRHYKPDRDKPEIIRVRRRGPGTFVLDFAHTASIAASDQVFGVDLFGYGGKKVQLAPSPGERPRNFAVDLKIGAKLDAGGQSYTVRFEAGDEFGGVQLQHDKLYTALDSGYQPSVIMSVPVRDQDTDPAWLYVRSRNPALYARLEISFRARAESLNLLYKGTSNPYGDQNLEWDLDAAKYSELLGRLEDDAERSIRAGRRPTRPDLKKLVDDFAARERAQATDTQASKPSGN